MVHGMSVALQRRRPTQYSNLHLIEVLSTTFRNRRTIENLLNTLGALFVEKEYDQNAALNLKLKALYVFNI